MSKPNVSDFTIEEITGEISGETIKIPQKKMAQNQNQRQQLQKKAIMNNKKNQVKENQNEEENGEENGEENDEKFGMLDISKMNFEFDRYFLSWLRKNKIGIVICSYKSNAIFSMGCTPNIKTGQDMLSLWITNAMRPMGASYDEKRKKLWIGSCLQLWQYYNQGKKKTDREHMPDFDACFVPRTTYTINDLDIHDVVLDGEGSPFFVSALFCCVCTPSDTGSFKVYWRPPWVSKTAAEDRCHLNGLCMRDGKPKYVTSVARTDIRGGWRDKRDKGGIIWDIEENKLVCKNLSMPHSPRYHNGKLWVLNSGTGHFGYVDFDTEETDEKTNEVFHPFVPKVFLPSYIRGISFVQDKYAIIGGSQDRHETTFQGLQLSKNMEAKGVEKSICAIFVVDLESFDVVNQFEFKGDQVKEIYDVTVIPNTSRPYISEMDFQALATEFKVDE